jgi:hypothetical protein
VTEHRDHVNEFNEVLHEMRLRGWIERADSIVEELLHRGLARRVDARVSLTSEGREVHARWARVVPGSETEVELDKGYTRFLEHNRAVLRLCTAWQVRPGNVPNDHSDVVYDWGVIDRLVSLDQRAGPLIGTLASALQRLLPYRPRLRSAVERVQAGAHEWLLSPSCDSYHTVWMQLHEDLLLALGRDRMQEEEQG